MLVPMLPRKELRSARPRAHREADGQAALGGPRQSLSRWLNDAVFRCDIACYPVE